MKNGRSRAPRMLMDGMDPDEVMRLQIEVNDYFLLLMYIYKQYSQWNGLSL